MGNAKKVILFRNEQYKSEIINNIKNRDCITHLALSCLKIIQVIHSAHMRLNWKK